MANKYLLQSTTPQSIAAGDISFGNRAVPAASITDSTTKAPVQALVQLADLSDGFGFTYNGGTQTLTAGGDFPLNVGLQDAGISNLLVNDRVLVDFEDDDHEYSGIYRISNLGAPANWAIGVTYNEEDLVVAGGIIWQSLGDGNVGNDPVSSPDDWELKLAGLTASSGAVAYAPGDTYGAGNVVGAGGFYISRADGNVGHTPSSSPAYWTPLGGLGDFNPTAAPPTLVRAVDFNSASTIVQGSNFLVTRGTETAGTIVYLTNTSFPVVVDTTPLMFNSAGGGGGGGSYTGGSAIEITGGNVINLRVNTGSGLSVGGGNTLQAVVDNSTLTVSGNAIQVAGGGITATQLNTGVAGPGLSHSGSNIAVNVDDGTLEINSDTLRVKDGGISGAKINNSVAGDGLTHTGTALAVNVDNSTIETNTDLVRLKDAGTTRAKLAPSVANASGITGFVGSTTTFNTGNSPVVFTETFVFPVNTIAVVEVTVVAVNDADASKTFAQTGYTAYRRGGSGDAFPVGDSESMTYLPAFAATGTGSIAGITWSTAALTAGSSGNIGVNVNGPGSNINVTYTVRARLY